MDMFSISGTPYVVTVQTGSETGAGTDAKVFITLNGDKNKITKRQLQKPEGGKDPFEKGGKDVFKFDELDVGKVRHLDIRDSVKFMQLLHLCSCKRSTSSTMAQVSVLVGSSTRSK